MSILGDDDSLLGSSPSGSEQNYAASLGRISGKLLSADLLRDGQDLTFRNASTDPDLLYLDVTNNRIGINTDAPVYDLDVRTDIRSTIVQITNQANLGNIRINSAGYFTTSVGPIHLYANNGTITYGRMTTTNFEFNDNYIKSFSNSNIVIDPNGTGTVNVLGSTNITGNLAVTGNITMSGNLRTDSNIIVGDQQFDTVTIVPDFTQSIIPGDDNLWSLGENTGDSSPRRWAQLHAPDWTHIGLLQPKTVTISDQLKIDGNSNNIFATQSNEDVSINPDTGITIIERTQWQDNTLTNLDNTPITFANTGIGYVRLMGSNGFVVPAGPTDQQRLTPDLGETRWNTDLNYLECFDGTVWTSSIGSSGSTVVTAAVMEELVNVYTLAFG